MWVDRSSGESMQVDRFSDIQQNESVIKKNSNQTSKKYLLNKNETKIFLFFYISIIVSIHIIKKRKTLRLMVVPNSCNKIDNYI